MRPLAIFPGDSSRESLDECRVIPSSVQGVWPDPLPLSLDECHVVPSLVPGVQPDRLSLVPSDGGPGTEAGDTSLD